MRAQPEWVKLFPRLKQEEQEVISQLYVNWNQENWECLLAMMEESRSEELTRYVLGMIEFRPFSPRIEKALLTVIKNRDGDIRAKALSILAKKSTDPQIREPVLRGLNDSDKRVIIKVLESIRSKGEDWQEHSSQILPLLQHPDDEIKVEALATFASMYKEDKVWQETHHHFRSFLQYPDHKIRIRVLGILSSFDNINFEMKEQIIQRLDDYDEKVVIKALGIIRNKEKRKALSLIKSLLEHPNRRVRVKALKILDSFWKHKLIYYLREFDSLLRTRLFSSLISFIEKFGYKPVVLKALKALDDMDEMEREMFEKEFMEMIKSNRDPFDFIRRRPM